MRSLAFVSVIGAGVASFAPVVQSTGICEQARIPLRTVHLEGGGSICVVPFCGENDQRRTPNYPDGTMGSVTCMKCDNSPWSGESTDYREKSDVCPTSMGTCDRGFCCPKKGPDTWFHSNFGKDWNGMSTFPFVTVTTYEGLTASGGTVAEVEAWLKEKVGGIDAIAAVSPQMFGSWMQNSKVGSQASYVNNNICYKVTGNNGKTYNIAIWGKCGGYAQCKGKPFEDAPGQDFWSPISSKLDDTFVYDANRCLNSPGTTIEAGYTPDCMAMNADGTQDAGKKCCTHWCQKHVDWCGSNDHPHLDIGEHVYNEICPEGPCSVKHIEPYLCDWNPPQDAMFGNWEPTFTSPKKPGDPEVAPVHEPYPEPHCEDTIAPPPTETTETPTDPTTPSGSLPTAPADPKGLPDCDSVTYSHVEGFESSCALTSCTRLCQAFMQEVCTDTTPKAAWDCLTKAIGTQLHCAAGNCGCGFAEK